MFSLQSSTGLVCDIDYQFNRQEFIGDHENDDVFSMVLYCFLVVLVLELNLHQICDIKAT